MAIADTLRKKGWAKQPDWKNAFFGNKYDKLLSIKQKYDPNHLFYVSPGVGADLLVATNGRLCKVGGDFRAPIDPTNSVPRSDNENVGPYDIVGTTFPMLYQGKGLPWKKNPNSRGSGPPTLDGGQSGNGTQPLQPIATPAGTAGATAAAKGSLTPMAGHVGMIRMKGMSGM